MRHFPLFLTLMAVPVLPATEIQVSHELTLSQALQQLREARKSGDTSPATIRLPKGKIDITQPLMLEAQDSNLTFIGTDSTLIGGPKVTGWEKHTREIVKADVSKLLPKGFLPKQLLCDGERQILARYPNFDAKDPLYGGWAFVAPFPPAGAPDGHQWKRTLFVKPEDVRTWAHPEDVQIDIFAQYGWWNFIEPIVSLDSATRLLTLKKDCSYDLHPHNRYHFQNALEELDAPASGSTTSTAACSTSGPRSQSPIATYAFRFPTPSSKSKVPKTSLFAVSPSPAATAPPSPSRVPRTVSSKTASSPKSVPLVEAALASMKAKTCASPTAKSASPATTASASMAATA
jgi:hypothetical protein